jgi:hypothetical protein
MTVTMIGAIMKKIADVIPITKIKYVGVKKKKTIVNIKNVKLKKMMIVII